MNDVIRQFLFEMVYYVVVAILLMVFAVFVFWLAAGPHQWDFLWQVLFLGLCYVVLAPLFSYLEIE